MNRKKHLFPIQGLGHQVVKLVGDSSKIWVMQVLVFKRSLLWKLKWSPVLYCRLKKCTSYLWCLELCQLKKDFYYMYSQSLIYQKIMCLIHYCQQTSTEIVFEFIVLCIIQWTIMHIWVVPIKILSMVPISPVMCTMFWLTWAISSMQVSQDFLGENINLYQFLLYTLMV
jgi:hypothetical protein